MCMHMNAYMCIIDPSLFHLLHRGRASQASQELSDMTGALSQPVIGNRSLCLPKLELQHRLAFIWVLGAEPQFSHWHGHLPSSRKFFLKQSCFRTLKSKGRENACQDVTPYLQREREMEEFLFLINIPLISTNERRNGETSLGHHSI